MASRTKILIKGGRLLCPFTGLDQTGDVLISGGLIEVVGKDIEAADCRIVEAQGKLVSPSFTDLHVHLREPGREDEETVASGARAALRGGFTTICCMPNTEPAIDNVAVAEAVLRLAASSGGTDIRIVGAITKGRQGRELAEIGRMHRELGIGAFSDDGSSVADADLMRRALEYVGIFDGLIVSHCEEPRLARGGQMHEGYYSTMLGLRGIPAAAEEVMVARDLVLAGLTGARLHIAHVSTEISLMMIRLARERGVRVTTEVTPHHLAFCEEDLTEYDTNLKVNPPLRSKKDREALWKGLARGEIDAIATDHAPHSREEKEVEFDLAACGAIGMESAWPALNYLLDDGGEVGVAGLVSALTLGPQRVLGGDVDRLGIREKAKANLVVLDCDDEYVLDAGGFDSLSRNCPWHGRRVRGRVEMTIKDGEIKYENLLTGSAKEAPPRRNRKGAGCATG